MDNTCVCCGAPLPTEGGVQYCNECWNKWMRSLKGPATPPIPLNLNVTTRPIKEKTDETK